MDNKEKVDAIITLQTNGYRASALRRIYIEKSGEKEKRPLGIPTMKYFKIYFQTRGDCCFEIILTDSMKDV